MKYRVLAEGEVASGSYKVADTMYENRPARVFYVKGAGEWAPQSGVAYDDNPDLLFDYNQRFLELAVGLLPSRVLVIGGGCYTLPMALLWALPAVQVDVVEPDSGLEALATRFFGLQPDSRLRIHHESGEKYLRSKKQTYDLIVIDAFEGAAIPPGLTSLETALQAKQRLHKDGVLAMNVIADYHRADKSILRQCYNNWSIVFPHTLIFPADGTRSLREPQNFLLTAHAGGKTIGWLRYPSLS